MDSTGRWFQCSGGKAKDKASSRADFVLEAYGDGAMIEETKLLVPYIQEI